MKKVTYVILFSLLIASCAGYGHQALVKELDSWIGVKTYDEVLKGWERPADINDEDGYITVTWIKEDYYMVDSPFRRGRPFAPTAVGRKIVMKFDKDTKILKVYKIEYW